MPVVDVCKRIKIMNDTLDYIAKKFNLDFSEKPPFFIDGGRGEAGLALLFKKLGFKIGAEIGVQRAEYSEVLGRVIPGRKLYGIDAWTIYEGYRDILGGQDRYDANFEIAKERTAFFDCVLIKKWSMDAVKDFKDESLDFVYLDANHDFSHVAEDINAWEKKIRIGGIISGHDFARSNQYRLTIHVKDVVRAWVSAHQISPWFVIIGDSSPNWMWVRTK